MFQWTRLRIETLTAMTLDGAATGAIAERLGCHARTVADMQVELELRQARAAHRPWTRAEIAELRRKYTDTPGGEIARSLRRSLRAVYVEARKLGLRKSPEFLSGLARKKELGRATRFKKGLVPHNKGVKRPGFSSGRMSETWFRKGQRGDRWRPLWSTRISKEGYLCLKATDTGYSRRDWVPAHVLLWEEKHGPAPRGSCVAFRDGDKTNIALRNLELLTRADLMRRNAIHNRYPKDVVNTIMLLGAVKRKLRERCRKTR